MTNDNFKYLIVKCILSRVINRLNQLSGEKK
ncbi:MAG: hypothetical protein ACJAWQ_001238 [Paraglaciecola sp.]|jgi:hypothetical protein